MPASIRRMSEGPVGRRLYFFPAFTTASQRSAPRDPFRPQEDVAVREGDPEPVLLEAQQDRIVQDAAVGIRDEDVFPLADLTLPQVPRREELHERKSVGSADLDVAFDGDVPESDVSEQMPVFLHRVVVVTRKEGVVVYGVRLTARLPRLVEERGPAEARATLDDRHVEPSRPRGGPLRSRTGPLGLPLGHHGGISSNPGRQREGQAIVEAWIKDSIRGSPISAVVVRGNEPTRRASTRTRISAASRSSSRRR